VLSRITMRSYSGLTDGEILLARGRRDESKDRYGSGPDLVLFRLVVPPLQPGVVGSYPVWGI
jgi:hypothetical protein